MAGLYIHIPFCQKKCAYCNFYSACTEASVVDNYLRALEKEIEKWGGSCGRPIETLYIGGGTPSVLGAKIAPLISKIKKCFNLTDDPEITVEMNPSENSAEFLTAARSVGVNRLSIGVQSGNDSELLLLGRTHTAYDTRRSVEKARNLGFSNISLDLMLALPESDNASLLKSLEFITELSPEHISAYILKLEDKTALKANKKLRFADEETQAKQYLLASSYLEKLGYEHYEISNFAKSGYQSQHNLKYWNLEEYLGIGPSAHSYFLGKRFYYKPDIKGFIKNPEIVFDGTGGDSSEYFMLKLRLSDGVDLKEFTDIYGDLLTPEFFSFCDLLEKEGLVKTDNERISLTDRGMLLSNTIITELLERMK